MIRNYSNLSSQISNRAAERARWNQLVGGTGVEKALLTELHFIHLLSTSCCHAHQGKFAESEGKQDMEHIQSIQSYKLQYFPCFTPRSGRAHV